MWTSYNGIPNVYGIQSERLTVNHSEHFIDPQTGTDTQSTQSADTGKDVALAPTYLREIMWRTKKQTWVQTFSDKPGLILTHTVGLLAPE